MSFRLRAEFLPDIRTLQAWQILHKRTTSMRLQHNAITLSRLIHELPAMPDNLRDVNDLARQTTWEVKPPNATHPTEP
jgi:hypothetical protein